jgi:hypothetical protein
MPVQRQGLRRYAFLIKVYYWSIILNRKLECKKILQQLLYKDLYKECCKTLQSVESQKIALLLGGLVRNRT